MAVSSAPSAPAPGLATGARRAAAAAALVGTIAVCVVLATLSVIVPLSALGQISVELKATGALLNWTLISSSVVGAAASGIFPPLASIFGQRAIQALAMGAVAAGSVLDAIAPNMTVLLIGRAVSALGLGAIAMSLAIVRTNLSGKALSLALGCIAAAEGIGAGLAFVFGGLLRETVHVGWRAIFWIIAVAALLATLAVVATVPKAGKRVVRRVDWLGGALLGAALVMMLVPLSMGPHWGWSSPLVWIELAVGVALAVVWWMVEDRTEEPMVNTRALRERNFLLGAGVFLVTAMLVWIMDFTIPSFVSAPTSTGFGFGYDALVGGMVMVLMCLGITVGGVCAGALARRVPVRVLCLVAFGVATLSMVLLAVAHGSSWQLWVWPGLFGLSYGIGVAGAYVTFMGALRPEQVSTAAGIGQTAGPIGAAVSGAGITAVLTAQVVVVGQAAIPTEHSFQLGWWIGAGLAVAGGLCALGIRPQPASEQA
ncbi:MFS transporter [Streptomyces spongiae]|uniref:MFS transporter n=1 Tax=Streptomyces spongiae TaxID=565072 RepID=A0A5N8XC75_9ACTN|nr:MFS transporter [Streptomyces spongiae]MPY56508.1 MFS transporter [Streptomyces spongiae]